jgi:hypothetical protein
LPVTAEGGTTLGTAMDRLRQETRRRRIWIAGALAVIGALAATDLLIGSVAGFWVAHPMFAGLVAFGIGIVVTVAIVDGLVRRREAERWSMVGDIAVRHLSGDALLALGSLINTLNFEDQADRMVRAQKVFESTGVRPGEGNQPPLLPDGFEDVLAEVVLVDPDMREAYADLLRGLMSPYLQSSLSDWAPVMVHAPELAEYINVFGMLSSSLDWIANCLEDFEESAQVQLHFWSNLRVFLWLFAALDRQRRALTGETCFFEASPQQMDRAWGLPFEAHRVHAARRRFSVVKRAA